MSRTHITKLDTRDWKGRTTSIELSPTTLLVGDSGSGKSAIFELITYLFVGHLGDPKYGGLGRNKEAIADFVGPNGGGGSVALSDGTSFSRSIARTPANGWTESLSIDGERHNTTKAAAAALCARFGDFFQAFNPHDIVNRSAEDFRDFMMQFGGEESYDAARICRLVILAMLYAHPRAGETSCKLILQKDFGTTPEDATIEQIHAIVDQLLNESERSIVRDIERLLMKHLTADGDGATEQITAALEAIQEFRKLSEREEKRGRLAAEGLKSTQNQTPAVPGELDDMLATLESLRKRETELAAQLSSQSARAEHIDTINSGLQNLQNEIASAIAERDSLTIPIDTRAIERERRHATETLDAVVASRDELRNKLHALQTQLSELEKHKHAAELRAARGDGLSELSARVNALRAALGNDDRTADDFEEDAEYNTDESKKMIALFEAKRDERRKSAAELSAIAEQHSAALKTTEGVVSRLEAKISAEEGRIGELKELPLVKLSDNLCESCRTVIAPLVDEESKRIAEIETAIRDMHAERSELGKRIEQLRKEHAEASRVADAVSMQALSAERHVYNWEKIHHYRMIDAKALREKAELARKLAAEVAEYESAKADVDRDSESVPTENFDARIAELSAAINENNELLEALNAQVTSARAHVDDVTRKIEAAERTNGMATELKAELEASIAEIRGEIASAVATRERILGESPIISTDAIAADLDHVREQIATQQARVDKKRAWLDVQTNYARTLAAAESRGTEYRVAILAEAAIKHVRERLMQSLTAPLKNHMDHFLRAFDQRLSSVIRLDRGTDRGGTVFRMGWRVEGQAKDIAFKTMSDEDKSVFIAAVGYAANRMADTKLPIMLVEASRASSRKIPALLRALRSVSHEFANIIVSLHVEDVPDSCDGWVVHNLSEAIGDDANDPALADAVV